MKHKIKSLSDLKHEQALLKIELRLKEEQVANSWVYFKQNYRTMLWREINPLKNTDILSSALGFLQPGLLPVIAEVVKGTAKGKPINLNVLGSTAKYAIASLGIKWLRKWIENKTDENVVADTIVSESKSEENN